MKTIYALLLLLATTASQAGSNCPQLYPNHTPIQVLNTIELCNSFYVAVYSEYHTAVILTSNLVRPTRTHIERDQSFRLDDRLRRPVTTSRYSKTGLDRGHMTPAADSSTPQEMSETFLLSNVTPQYPTLNRGSWKELEEMIRSASIRNGGATVLTIASYNKPKEMNGIPIPAGYWKVVYYTKNTKAPEFYYAPNVEGGEVRRVDPRPINDLIKPIW